MRNLQFVNEQFYHVFNRGVDGRAIFMDTADFRRFYTSLYLFNDANFSNPSGKEQESLLETIHQSERAPLVNVLSFCLVPNHFHLLLEQVQEKGIPKFLHRLEMGYARYFNMRRERKGRLYESTFKAVHVKRDAQFNHLPRYIHLNALDPTDLRWRDGLINDWERAEKFLEQYQWSSHNVYNGQTQPLPVIDEQAVSKLFSTPKEYQDYLKEWSGRSAKSLLET